MHAKRDDEEIRFKLELEFVQSLANPAYIQWLFQSQYFSKPEFVNYLAYLLYWRQPEYAVYVTFPYCLEMLGMLQDDEFRQRCGTLEVITSIHQRQHLHWYAFYF